MNKKFRKHAASLKGVRRLCLIGWLMVPIGCRKAAPDMGSAFGQATVSLVHLAPGTPELTWKIGDKTGDLSYGHSQTDITLMENNYDLKLAMKDTGEELAAIGLPLRHDRHYSVFINGMPSRIGVIWTDDDLSAPGADLVKLRFVNMIPYAGTFDLFITGQRAALFRETKFRTVSGFIAIDPDTISSLELRGSDSEGVLALLENLNLKKGKIYTICVSGLRTAVDSTKLALVLMAHRSHAKKSS